MSTIGRAESVLTSRTLFLDGSASMLRKLINSTELYFILVVISQSADATAAQDSLRWAIVLASGSFYFLTFDLKSRNSRMNNTVGDTDRFDANLTVEH